MEVALPILVARLSSLTPVMLFHRATWWILHQLFTRSTCRNPLQIAPTATGLPYTYSTPYPMLTFIYNIYYCHHRHVFLFLPPLPLSSPPSAGAQCISTKLVLYVSCIYHRMSVYILCTPTKCRICTTPVVSHPLLPHNHPP